MKTMKLITTIFLLMIFAGLQAQYKYVMNKRTGKFDMVVDTAWINANSLDASDTTDIRNDINTLLNSRDSTVIFDTRIDSVSQAFLNYEADSVVNSSINKELADSADGPTFGLGRGIAVDTTAMVNGAYGLVYKTTQDSTKVDAVYSVMIAGTGTEAATFNVFWGPTFGTAVDSLFTAATAITSLTGEIDIPNRHYKAIPPRNWVWGIYRGMVVGHRPTLISSTLIIHTKREP